MTAQMHIAEYDEMANKLDEIKEYSNFLPDVSTDEGYSKSKRVSLDIGKVKTSLEKVRKEKKAHFIEGGKQVDTQAKSILEKLNDMQLPHMEAYKELDNLKKEREAKRKQGLEDRVAFIRNLPEILIDSCSDEIKGAMNDMNNEGCETFYEFTSAALKARNETIKLLGDLFTKTLKSEKDAEELIKLRAEQAKREQEDREAKIAQQAKGEAERIAKIAQDKIEQEKQEAIQREEQAKQAVIDSENRAKQQAEEAKQNAINAENARLQAEENAKQEAIQSQERAKQAAMRAEEQRKQDSIIAERKAKEAAEKATQAEQARQQKIVDDQNAETQRLASNNKHVTKYKKEAKESLIKLGIDEKTAVKIVQALSHGEIKNCSINY